ncbi:DUF6233 domain-containing protein [Streptomyces sp. NBC_01006]|uniref:DUF6233 domain-containing protein n=1 Tax=Streptomyces sp. NBC_01006 TaxID=2903716 RepID=UPI003864690A
MRTTRDTGPPPQTAGTSTAGRLALANHREGEPGRGPDFTRAADRAEHRCRPTAGPRTRRGCRGARKRCTAMTLEEARRALAEENPASPHCRPDTALGMPE